MWVLEYWQTGGQAEGCEGKKTNSRAVTYPGLIDVCHYAMIVRSFNMRRYKFFHFEHAVSSVSSRWWQIAYPLERNAERPVGVGVSSVFPLM